MYLFEAFIRSILMLLICYDFTSFSVKLKRVN
jgi:hypothetical protein